MPREFPRSRRVAEQVQREMSEIIRLDLKDPRVGMVTITDVDVSPDCKNATVYLTTLGGEAEATAATRTLNRASGFLRSRLAGRLRLRMVPQLQFRFDASVERGARLARLIDEAISAGDGNAADTMGNQGK